MQDQATPRMFRVKALAQMYDVSVSTIYRAIESGDLNALRIGTGKGAIRIPESALAAFEKSCVFGPRDAANDPECLAATAPCEPESGGEAA